MNKILDTLIVGAAGTLAVGYVGWWLWRRRRPRSTDSGASDAKPIKTRLTIGGRPVRRRKSAHR